MGTHAEKEYFEKLGSKFDGVIFGANLIESTPGATASLIVKLGGEEKNLAYFIDPMTYAFGTYFDPATSELRDDLDWIKSDQKVKGKNKTVRAFKRSYRKLAERLGSPFQEALEGSQALTPALLEDRRVVASICESAVDYQVNRIRREFEADEEYAEFADDIPSPEGIIAPYFYIEPSQAGEWMEINLALASSTVRYAGRHKVYALICAPKDLLGDESFVQWVEGALPRSGIAGVWLWFSRFDEHIASLKELRRLKGLVTELARRKMEVLNLHGGFFSLALHELGLSGISHGVGYGEQKDVLPVIGQSTPTVRYYLPALRKRLGVPDIERCFRELKIRTVEDFHATICDCAICKGVLRGGLSQFAEFGEKRFSTPDSKREAQTPAAAKRCRFHFLLNRSAERKWVGRNGLPNVIDDLEAELDKWGSSFLSPHSEQLQRWITVLSE